MLKKVLKYFSEKENRLVFALIVLGSICWSLTMVRSGLCFDKDCASGIGFWGANGHDGIWHISLIKSLMRGSFENPVFAGEKLKNYHIGFDLLVSFISRISGVDPILLYFQVLPPLIALLIGLLVYIFVFKWTKNKLSVFWALFFVYFGGGLGWVVTLVREGKIAGDSMFWAQSSATTLINPPFSLSLIFLLLGLIFFSSYLHNSRILDLILTVVFWGLLVQIKIYASILVLGSLFLLLIYSFLFKKDKLILVLKSLVLVFLISVFVYLISVRSSTKLIQFRPFWFLETMMLFGDRLHWERFYQALISYVSGRIYLKAFFAYVLAFVIFLVGNLGTRMISFFWFIRKDSFLKKSNLIEAFLFFLMFFGVLLPMLFIQEGTAWNTIQFFYYSLFVFGIFSGIFLARLISVLNKSLSLFLIISLVFLTLPTTVATMGHYLARFPQAKISLNELNALRFLSSQPKGTVLSLQIPGTVYDNNEFPTSLYRYDSTAYVSAFSGQTVYLEDMVNLNIMNYNWSERLAKIEMFLSDPNSVSARNFLRKSNISYIYLVKRMGVGLDEKALNIKNIYDNDEVIVYKVLPI